jgi:hypothetical protein
MLGENKIKTEKYSNTPYKILLSVFSIVYGLFVVTILERHLHWNSGDLDSYLYFFNNSPNYLATYEGSIFQNENIFRNMVFGLQGLFDEDFEVIFGYIAFICSTTIFYICLSKVRSRKYLIVILPFLLMIFFTPRVVDLFASSLRSGIAFTIFIISNNYLKGVRKYILMMLSILIHLSMLPIISLYLLFYTLHKKRVNVSYLTSIFVLLLFSLIVNIGAKEFHSSIGINTSFYYNFLVFLILLLIVFTNKKVINNVYGFLSIGLIVTVILGFILDFNFIRFVGNSLLLYLFFVLDKGSIKTIQVFTLGYIPFFVLTNYYTITNHW